MKFMELYRAGKVSAEDIDDFIDKWHEDTNFKGPIYDFLGMTRKEYMDWMKDLILIKEEKS